MLQESLWACRFQLCASRGLLLDLQIEARVALEETLKRFPTWEVDEDNVAFVHTNSVRGPASVPVVL